MSTSERIRVSAVDDEAVRVAGDLSPDMVVMDVMMPKVDGADTYYSQKRSVARVAASLPSAAEISNAAAASVDAGSS